MAQYKHLPIYKTTYELLTLITKRTKDYPRDFKYSLGDKIRNECVDLVVLIYKANSIKNRNELIETINERLNLIELLLRLSKDMRLLSVQGFAEIVELTDSLMRQANGWLKSQAN